MKKLTTKEYIDKAIKIHGDKYDYSRVEYINAQTKICIICPEHGEFWQKPYNHLNGTKCPLCNRSSWDTSSFINRAKEIHGNKYDYSKVDYTDSRTKVCIICPEHGEFWQYPLSHLNGMGCRHEKKGIQEDKWETRVCPICGNSFNVRKRVSKITCSSKCLKEYCLIHKDEINKKRGESVRKTFSLKSSELKKESREKAKKTCLERYGVDSYSKTDIAREFFSENMKKNRENINIKLFKEVLEPKYRKICEDDDLELLNFRSRFNCLVKCKKCGNIFTTKTLGYLTDSTTQKRCRKCNPIEYNFQNTKQEEEFENYLNENNIRYKKHHRGLISPMEVDFYLYDYNIAVEFNGLYWHSEVIRDNNYHVEKSKQCKDKGINLIHFYEDEWNTQSGACINSLKLFLNKKTENNDDFVIKENNNKNIIKDFLEKNSLQVYRNFKYGYCLYMNNELKGVITLKKRKSNEYEMINICFKDNIDVNFIKKVFEIIKNKFSIKRVYLSLDKRFEDIDFYKNILNYTKDSKPNFYYVIKHRREDRNKYRKENLVKRYNCPKEKTEHEFCIENKWYRIYDCGRAIFDIILS